MKKFFSIFLLMGGFAAAQQPQAQLPQPPTHPTVEGFSSEENKEYENFILRKQLLDRDVAMFQTQATQIQTQLNSNYQVLLAEAKKFSQTAIKQHKLNLVLNPDTLAIEPPKNPALARPAGSPSPASITPPGVAPTPAVTTK